MASTARTAPYVHDETEIRNLLADGTRALRAKDADLALAHLAEDVVSFDLEPPLQFTGADARDKQGVEAWFRTWRGPIGWELRDPQIAIGGDVAFVHGLGHMTGTKTDGEVVDLWVRCTLCLRHRGGAWQITRQHMSVPFYMDGSYRAAVDLRP
jgi:ketosteroid isomerase-like protein